METVLTVLIIIFAIGVTAMLFGRENMRGGE
jgi:hypothetical protein